MTDQRHTNTHPPSDSSGPTPPEDQTRFKKLAALIRGKKLSPFQTAQAVAEINRKHLYLAKYRTFEACCEEELRISRSHAYEQIAAVDTYSSISSLAPKYGLSSAQIPRRVTFLRELRRLPCPAERCRVLATVIRECGDSFTAKDLRKKTRPNVKEEKFPYVSVKVVKKRLIKLRAEMEAHYGELDWDIIRSFDAIFVIVGGDEEDSA